jgi:hypothetical protein
VHPAGAVKLYGGVVQAFSTHVLACTVTDPFTHLTVALPVKPLVEASTVITSSPFNVGIAYEQLPTVIVVAAHGGLQTLIHSE